MLELFGSGYVIEHCIAAIKAEMKDESYRCYVTDCFMNIVNMLAGKQALKKRYYDILHPAPVDERSAEEIVADNIKRLGLKVVK